MIRTAPFELSAILSVLSEASWRKPYSRSALTQDDADATRAHRPRQRAHALAWWRTGLTALAVALAVGRVVPELGNSGERWPYTVVGLGFALYGVALIDYGTSRSRAVMAALRKRRTRSALRPRDQALTGAGVLLGPAHPALIVDRLT